MSQLTEMSDREFVNYLLQVSADHKDAGHEATAEDYDEAVRRLEHFIGKHGSREGRPTGHGLDHWSGEGDATVYHCKCGWASLPSDPDQANDDLLRHVRNES